MGGRFDYVLISDDVKRKIFNSGGLPIGLMPLDEKYGAESFKINSYELTEFDAKNLANLLGCVQGVVLQGGLVLNAYEQHIAELCLSLKKPVLGICCGFDVLLMATGHVIKQNENNFHWNMEAELAHEIELKSNSFFYSIVKEKRLQVNSLHKTIIFPNEISDEWRVGAVCLDDGSVEAIEFKNSGFALGVRFHPELMNNGGLNEIFKSFVKICEEQ